MTKLVSVQQDIRLLDAKGVPWREIARRLGVSRETVKKYAQTVDALLGADLRMPRKQRNTAR